MRLHRSGYIVLSVLTLLIFLIWLVLYVFSSFWWWIGLIVGSAILIWAVSFFRHPSRPVNSSESILAPCDGKVVVIEEVEETKYFKNRRWQVSIFMSPFNVHVNNVPVSGIVKKVNYQQGSFRVAWHPKSSLENEMFETIIDSYKGPILVRQIAGVMARRVLNYLKQGQTVRQGDEMGFIRFGSRVDLILPLDTDINVAVGEKVKGNITVIGI